MKLVRPLLILLGSLIALLAVAIGVAFIPGIQGWAVRRALAQQPELKIAFGSVAATPWSLRLESVRVERQGLTVAIEHAEANFSAWQYLTGRRIQLDRLVASGVVVDAARLSPARAEAGAAGAPVAAPGALARLQLPWAVAVGELQIAGRVTLPASPGRTAPAAEFQLSGGGLAPGREGTFQFKSRVVDGTPAARVTALGIDARLVVRETTTQSFDRASVTLAVDAEGPQFSGGHQLTLAAGMQIEAGAENYVLSLDTRRKGVAENLLKLDAAVPSGGQEVSGHWAVRADEKQVEPFFLGELLPRFQAVGQGALTLNLQSRALTLRGELTADADALEVIDPTLRPLGKIHLQTDFNLAASERSVRFQKLRVDLAGDNPVLAFEALQPLNLELRERNLVVAAGGATGPLARLDIQRLPVAWLRPFVTAAELSGGVMRGAFSLEENSDGVRLRSTAPFVVDEITVVSGGRRVLDRAALSLNLAAALDASHASAKISDLALRTAAGDEIAAEATVRTPFPKSGPIDVQARFTANLPRLLENFAPVGHVRLKGEVDATHRDPTLEVRTLRAELADASGKPLLTFSTAQAGTLDLASLRWQPANAAAEVARVELAALDFAKLPALQAILPLRGQTSGAVFSVTAKDGRVLARAAAPLRFQALTLPSVDGQPTLDRANMTVNPSLDFGSRNDWKVHTGEVTISNADQANWLTSSIELKNTALEGLRATVQFNADIAALAAQPAFAALRPLASGRASGEIRAARVPGAAQVEGRATLNNLVLRDSPQPLPIANISFRALRGEDGRIKVEVPILLDRLGQRSDLKFTAEAVRREDGIFFEAKVAGEHLELADALALAALGGAPVSDGAAPSATPVRPTATGNRKPDVRPFWSGLRGEVAVDLKQVTRGKDWVVTGLGGYLAIEGDRISLQRVQGTINSKSRLGARADLRFSSGAMPYRLTGNFSLTDFDVGAAMKAFDPGKPPVVEGVFTVAGGFTGDGANLDQTHERTRGQFQLTSRQGIFRGLKRSTEKVSVATKTVDAVAALGSLFGGDKIKGVAEKVAGSSYQVDQLAQSLGEIQFDQLIVRATRDDALNLRLDELALLSPEVRLIGKGSVTHVDGKPLMEQPLSVSYSLAASGKIEQLLGKLRVLDGSKDDLGYAKMKDLGTIGGTLNRPDPSQLFIKLAQSKLVDFLN